MISTTNYVARKYGVRAAMPGFIGKKLCPQLVFVKTHFEKYTLVAEQIRAVIRQYDPDFTSHSLDEVYMDLTDAATLYVQNQRMSEVEIERRDMSSTTPSSHSSRPLPSSSSSAAYSNPSYQSEIIVEDDCHFINKTDALTASNKSSNLNLTTTAPTPLPLSQSLLRKAACIILEDIRNQIQVVTGGLTSSAGIANNFFLAKICADINKPNGQFELPGNRQGTTHTLLFLCIYIYLLLLLLSFLVLLLLLLL